jgi:hypothetical protein
MDRNLKAKTVETNGLDRFLSILNEKVNKIKNEPLFLCGAF